MAREELGFLSSPINGMGILRARTLLGNLRLWDIPRSEQALNAVSQEIGQSPIPGLYLLIDARVEKKIYIGQSEDVNSRIYSHMKAPDVRIKNWQRALIINDGRKSSQSDLNDENIRLVLENYLVNLFKINRYQVVTLTTREPTLSATQITLVKSFKQEINTLLYNMGKITRFLTGRLDDEVYLDEAKKRLIRSGHSVQEWGEKYAMVDQEPVVIRPGSIKPKGWQVTFRGSRSFAQLKMGEGFLFMPRGKLVLLPLREVKEFVLTIDHRAFERDTVDIFLRFEVDRIVLVYKHGEKEITDYSVEPYLEK